MRFGNHLSVRIGIHTGQVIAGVVGETKPQFSLIGASVNKTARVCAKCPPSKIFVSKETRQCLEEQSNNFTFGAIDIEMKGIGKEQAFTVSKRRNPNRFQKNHEIPMTGNIMKKKQAGDRQRDRFNRLEDYGGASNRETRAHDNQGHNSFRVRYDASGNSRNDDSVTLNDDDFDHHSVDDSLED